jgi:hypothetical protein
MSALTNSIFVSLASEIAAEASKAVSNVGENMSAAAPAHGVIAHVTAEKFIGGIEARLQLMRRLANAAGPEPSRQAKGRAR